MPVIVSNVIIVDTVVDDNVNFSIRNDHGMELPEEGSYATGLIFMDEASEEKTR
jgi:hypothetical protein